jgi:hypothetical protein
MKKYYTAFLLLAFSFVGRGQTPEIPVSRDSNFPDSVLITIHPRYNRVSGIHRMFFGENYRKEWATQVKLPVIRVSRINGGLSPERYGGGMETKSIRMIDKTGKEWVLRSVEKIPDKLLPENLRQTFALDWVDDEYSGQHPYSALIIPPLAEAAHVPHAHPVIGVLEADTSLGTFNTQFAGRVVLFEEREPTGQSDNTGKTIKELDENYNIHLDGREVLRARMLDLLIGDWDRHEDQWRWNAEKTDKGKVYTAVPRDRDQALHVVQGMFPGIAAEPWIDPVLGNFSGNIPNVKYSLMKTRFMQPFPDVQLSFKEWMEVVNKFTTDESDAVLATSVSRLPEADQKIRGKEILEMLKGRRNRIPAAMAQYYKFINRIADLRTSDRDEYISVNDGQDSVMIVTVSKLTKSGKPGDLIWKNEYIPSVTQELRLYIGAGNDHLSVNTTRSPVRLRIIDSAGLKNFDIVKSAVPIQIYGPKDSATITGDLTRVNTHFSNNPDNTRFVQTDPYNVWMPLASGAINSDDGFLLSLGFRYTGRSGFRKLPFSTVQEVMVTHAFETNAFRINYSGQWIQAIGKADITLDAIADAPDNTMNFFGQGNATMLNKTGDYHKFYRARFDYYKFDPALRWHTAKTATLSIGPSFQYYHYGADGNSGRSVNVPGLIRSYDSTNYQSDKVHGGIAIKFVSNKRNNTILPSAGYYLEVNAAAYAGLNSNSRGYAQIRPEFTYFLRTDTGARLVFSDRVGGGLGTGDPAFYQSMFLGGQGNLLGYLQNRFAGQQMAFNNLQARFRLANIPGYILPGELGLSGFYDVGRVWISGEHSDTWHQGTGGGLYFVPAGLTVIQLLWGHSNEGWYPYISLNFRL